MKPPTAIKSIDENTLIIAEGGIFSVWDLRTAENDGCCFREPILDGSCAQTLTRQTACRLTLAFSFLYRKEPNMDHVR